MRPGNDTIKSARLEMVVGTIAGCDRVRVDGTPAVFSIPVCIRIEIGGGSAFAVVVVVATSRWTFKGTSTPTSKPFCSRRCFNSVW